GTALAAHPENAALLDALANYRLDRGEGWAALELARKARSSAPRWVDPMLTEARALDAVGLSARAALLRIDAAKARPDLSRARRAAASAYRRLGRDDEAMAELKQTLALRFDEAEARGDLTSLALDRCARRIRPCASWSDRSGPRSGTQLLTCTTRSTWRSSPRSPARTSRCWRTSRW